MPHINEDAAALAALSPRNLAAVKEAIKHEFGICNLDMAHAEFFGADYAPGRQGMRYGYLTFNRAECWVVDCTPDTGDQVVRKIGL